MTAGNGENIQREAMVLARASAVEVPATVWSPDRVELLRKTIAPELNHDELALFVEVCKLRRLDPFAREIFARKRTHNGNAKVTFETSIDGFRIKAEETGEYAGQVGPFWCAGDGEWKDVWLSRDPPAAAKVGVFRKSFADPLWVVAKYAEYLPANEKEQFMWRKMPATMIAKCAEALALRKAFPRQLAGLYSSDEMAQANAPHDARGSAHAEKDDAEHAKIADDTIALMQDAENDETLNALYLAAQKAKIGSHMQRVVAAGASRRKVLKSRAKTEPAPVLSAQTSRTDPVSMAEIVGEAEWEEGRT